MDCTQPWGLADVTFSVEGRPVYANKMTLTIASQVFATLFTANFAERSMKEILIGKKFDEFVELMEVIHPQSFKPLDDSNVHTILPMADEYAMSALFRNACKVLAAGPPSIHSLNLAHRYELRVPELIEKCFQYLIDTPLAQLKQEEGFNELRQDVLIEALEAKVEKLEPLQQLQNLKKELSVLTDWGTLHQEERCRRNIDTGLKHYKGADEGCGFCNTHRFIKVMKLMEKYK